MLLTVSTVGLIASAILFLVLFGGLRALDADAPPSIDLPPLTVIRPVRGLDPGLEENARSALRMRYPAELETIFVLDDESDPALPVLRRVIAAMGASARIVLSGKPPTGRTGKLHAMIHGLAAARASTPLVCFADSDTRPDPGVIAGLASIVACSRDVGAAFARVIGTRPPRTVGDVGYALLLDALYGPQAALASRGPRRALPFVMGQTMVLRRSALDACGGLEGSEGELVDDMHIGARLAAAGYRNVISRSPVAIVQEGLSFSELRGIALRWMVFARTGIPFWPFNLPTIAWLALYVGALAGAAVSIALGDPAALAGFVATCVTVVLLLEVLRTQQGGAALPVRLWWAPFVCLALIPYWFVRARFARTIVWRGRTYSLDRAGRLGTALPPAPVGQMP